MINEKFSLTNGGMISSGGFPDSHKTPSDTGDALLRSFSSYSNMGDFETTQLYYGGNGCSYGTHTPGGSYDVFSGVTRKDSHGNKYDAF